jgi:predicted PurR-regulated permease PerM
MWYRKKFFKVSASILLILAIIYLSIQVLPVVNYAIIFLTTLLFPVIIALVLYYAARPIRDFLEKKRAPRLLAIGFIFVLILIFISLIVMFIWPTVSQEVSEFSDTPQEKLKAVENKTLDFINLFNFNALSHDRLKEILLYYLQKGASLITENIAVTLSSIAKIASFFIITPFLLFYFLKDDHKMHSGMVRYTPENHRQSMRRILTDVDDALSSFISSQLIVAFNVGLLIFVGYWLIGLNYAFLLALMTMVFNLIPFCGPFISTIPALIIGLSVSPFMAVKVVAVVLIVHLLDINLISPRVVGNRLQVHPITIILLLVLGLSSLGILGAFVSVPLYAVVKVIIKDIYEIQNEGEAVINARYANGVNAKSNHTKNKD